MLSTFSPLATFERTCRDVCLVPTAEVGRVWKSRAGPEKLTLHGCFPVYLTSRPARARSCANAPVSLIRSRGEIFDQLPLRKARTRNFGSDVALPTLTAPRSQRRSVVVVCRRLFDLEAAKGGEPVPSLNDLTFRTATRS